MPLGGFRLNSIAKAITEAVSAAWNLASATMYNDGNYYKVGPAVSSLEGTPTALHFKSDGTKVYILGSLADLILEFSLTTAWDIRTMSASVGQTFSVNPPEGTASALFFKSDGTRMYVLGSSPARITQWNLSTAWDLSTATQQFSTTVGLQDTSPIALYIKPDGTKFYIVGGTNDRVYQFSFATAWELSGFTYDNLNFLISGQETNAGGLFFKDDGTAFWIVGSASDNVRQYSLSTAWDVSTGAIVSGGALTVAIVDQNSSDLFFRPDGTSLYVLGTSNDRVIQINLTTAWSIVGIAASNINNSGPGYFWAGINEITPTAVKFKSDGTRCYTVGSTSDAIRQMNLSPPWNFTGVSSASASLAVGTQEANTQALFFRDNGTRFYIVGPTSGRVHQYTLGTAWEVNTGTYDNVSILVNGQSASPQALFFKPDGTRMYVAGTGAVIYQYNLSTAWDLSTASYANISVNLNAQLAGLCFDIYIKSDGTKLWAAASRFVYQYTLGTAWDITTATYDNVSLDTDRQTYSALTGFDFKDDGTRFYVVNTTTDIITSYQLT